MPVSVDVTLDQLRSSAERGCWFCSVLHGGIIAAPPWDHERREKIPTLPWFRMPADKRNFDRPDFSIKVFGDAGHNQEPRLVFYIDRDAATSSPCKLFLVRTEPAHADPHQQLAFAAQRLRSCLEDHSCAPPTPPTMPTRLLHVQVSYGKYAIHIATGVFPQPYVTLSHCWGKSFPSDVTTTLENLDARMLSRGIPWDILPQTFRDAVALTERLGFQYLWIDALCIIQNSPADWVAESSRMCDVYSYGALMLSADASPDSQTGMFRAANMSSRPWRALAAIPLPPPATGDKALWRDHGVKTYHDMVHGITLPALAYQPPETLFHQHPLATRAWCFQERRLARRVVRMAVDEVLWDCAGGVLECQCGYLAPGSHEFGTYVWQRTLAGRECSAADKQTLWMNTVYEYSERNLSVWTDRLPALSGLAKQFQAVSKDPEPDQELKRPFGDISLGTYLAGIWSSSLPLGLCWHAAHTPGKRLSTVSSRYVAPSWSWASVSGNVNWDTRDFRPLVEVIDAQCIHAGPDETGSVCGGDVRLKARIIPVRLLYGDVAIPRTEGLRYTYMHLEARDPSTGQYARPSMYRPDYVPQHISSLQMVFHAGADMIWGDASSGEWVNNLTPLQDAEYFGLQLAVSFIMVVRPVLGEGPDVYERVGSVQMRHDGAVPDLSRWFDGADLQTVKLI